MRRAPHRLLLALAVSVGVHAFVWLLLEARARHQPESPRPAPPATLTFVEVEVAPPPPPAAPTEPPRPPPTEPPRPPRPAPPRPRVAEQQPTPPPPAVTQAPAPAPDVPRADVPRMDAPLTTGGPRLVPDSLLPSAMPIPESTASAGPHLSVDAGVPDPRAPPPPEKIVSDLVAESVGRGKVARGLVHPYFSTLGKHLLKTWDAERAVTAQGLSGFLDQGKQNGQAWRRIWNERAAAYGATGSPLAPSDAPVEAQRRPGSGDPNLDARREMRKQMREQFLATKRAVIRVVQDAQGQLISAELVVPSNNAQVDREALADVRAAAARLPPPPPEALAGRTTLTSLWQFELIISISPPVPSLSFEFDEALKFVDMRLPLDRRIYKRVRLLEVQ